MTVFEIGGIRQAHLRVDEFQILYQGEVLMGKVGWEPGECRESETDREVPPPHLPPLPGPGQT